MNCAKINCPPSPSFPLLGFNSETQDVPTFTAMGWSFVVPPPLNFDIGLTQGFAIATSTTSKQVAASLAQSQAVAQVVSEWIPPREVPPLLPGDNEWPFDNDQEFESVPPIY